MFTGFPEETVQFFLELRYHNNAGFFHEQHDRYVETVQAPFYALINELAPTMRDIDPLMETRPHKCLSRIHRDTRFSRDKSPYRDHLWLCFRRAAEPRDGSVNYWFEFGPDQLGWGMGLWGENKPLSERLRREIVADPRRVSAMVDSCDLSGHDMALAGSFHKRMPVPEGVPEKLRPWYLMREVYIPRLHPVYHWAYTERIVEEVRRDFETVAPLYRLLRGIQDDLNQEARLAEQPTRHQMDEW